MFSSQLKKFCKFNFNAQEVRGKGTHVKKAPGKWQGISHTTNTQEGQGKSRKTKYFSDRTIKQGD